MAKEFTYRSYSTTYRYAKTCTPTKKTEYYTHEKSACFSSFFNDCGGERTIIVEMHSGLDYLLKEHQDNACLFTKNMIESHIKEAQKLFDFNFSVSRKKKLKDNYWGYEVSLTINGLKIEEKYLVTWVRYLYEFPFNVVTREAYKLKELDEFKDVTIENLILVILNCHIVGDGWERGIHSVPRPGNGKLYTTEELKNKIKELGKKNEGGWRELNSIYLDTSLKNCVDFHKKHTCTGLDYWDNSDLFEERKNVYKKVLETN